MHKDYLTQSAQLSDCEDWVITGIGLAQQDEISCTRDTRPELKEGKLLIIDLSPIGRHGRFFSA